MNFFCLNISEVSEMADQWEMWISHGRWILMWTLAVSIYFSAKLLMMWEVGQPRGWRWWGYVWLWPGLDVKPWLRTRGHVAVAEGLRWFAGLPALGIGLALIAGSARVFESGWLQTWVGMVGVILCLHFGAFRWLAFFWQRVGVPVKPIMDAPLLAGSLSEFWGGRWNRGFRDFAQCCIGLPVARRWGRGVALWSVFVFSGVIHELVISVPARTGYGWPFGYFVLQAVGVMAEKHFGFKGHLWVLTVTGPGAVLLFHPPFVERVMSPFLETLRHLLP